MAGDTARHSAFNSTKNNQINKSSPMEGCHGYWCRHSSCHGPWLLICPVAGPRSVW